MVPHLGFPRLESNKICTFGKFGKKHKYMQHINKYMWRNAGSERFLAYLIKYKNKRRGAARGGGGWGNYPL